MQAGLFGCTPAQPGPPVAAATAADVRSEDSQGRPSLTLVDRKGDPQQGLAMAVYLEGSPRATVSLAWMLDARLQQADVEADVRASPFGLVISALHAPATRLGPIVRALHGSLVTPPTAEDETLVKARWRARPPPQARSQHEAATAWCAGELLLAPGPALPAPGKSELTDWLNNVSVSDVSYAVVGTARLLEQARTAVNNLPTWSAKRARVAQPARQPTLPESRRGIELTQDADGLLSVAVDGLDPSRATALAEHLGSPDSLLGVRMASGFPAWQTVRVGATLSRSSACLRADFHSTGAAPSVKALRRSVSMALDEVEHGLSVLSPTQWMLDKQVLAVAEPDQAAAVAAWHALTVRTQAAPVAKRSALAHYSGRVSDPDNTPQFSSLAPLSVARRIEETATRLESGQGQYWMLLASPCGTAGENAGSAGQLALTLHALAFQHTNFRGVSIEPWITSDAAGLLAHAGPLRQAETPRSQAERIAEALAQAILSSGPSNTAIGESRAELKRTVGGESLPGYWLALRQGSANHPSWFEPHGSWTALSDMSAHSVQQERIRWSAGKLRLAVLGNFDASQVQAGQTRLLNLLEGVHRAEAECPQAPSSEPLSGRYRLASAGSRGPSATLLLAWPTESDLAAQWTAGLLNRSGGWLEQALTVPGLVSSGRARVMGGREAKALVIELVAVEGRIETAVAQIRGLFDRLRAGAVTAQDLEWVREQFAQHHLNNQLDPRARIVDLWRGTVQSSPPSREQVLTIHERVFGAGKEVVVLSTPRR